VKGLWKSTVRLDLFLAVAGAAMLLGGCQTRAPQYAIIEGLPVMPGNPADTFRPGDQVTITFSPSDLAAPCRLTVKDDGSIMVPQVGTLIAAGKTPEALRREALEKHGRRLQFQPHYMTRYFYVTGEVNRPGPLPYLGETDLLRAIVAAGDMTAFAKKDKIQIHRASGRTETIRDYLKANNPRPKVSIFPGDTVHVPRR
jgi:polysaccharide export outer membrane protein